ncbi:efflux RND transporter periplasmic adaptor subunit [Rhodoferax sp. PAMC 29310]|uniref:efflux RND transporter periplasmic adaptor subunit n=1 Tax=Rhodoferax sp. PAMC 29310 TaxID=2822760 RepID=UPI001B3233B4|nr:efflux RND transporter periplasmic adaptor subunit [Rhodoferax sp. PAMC 29310]
MNSFTVKPLTLGLVLASFLTLGGLGLLTTRSDAADAPTAADSAKAGKPSLTVSLTQATAGQMPITLLANGSVAAWQEASVGAEVNGLRIQELHAQVGDSVKRGQLLATLSSDGVQADLALARASLAEATALAAEAAANAERARAVQGTGALSAQQINQFLTGEMTAKARVESAKAQRDAQQLRLNYTRIVAPDAGIISARTASVGAVVGAGADLFRLIRQGRLEWRGEVTAAELGRVKPGTRVTLTAPGGDTAEGKVRLISPTVDAQTRNGLVYVDFSAPQTRNHTSTFKPGVFARGEIALGQVNAMTVVQTAVVVRDGFSYVYQVDANSRVSQLKVKTGAMVGDRVEIVNGVTLEQKLVASGASFLSEGDLVKVVDISKPNQPSAPTAPAQAASK